jgi:hypothetical protein
MKPSAPFHPPPQGAAYARRRKPAFAGPAHRCCFLQHFTHIPAWSIENMQSFALTECQRSTVKDGCGDGDN